MILMPVFALFFPLPLAIAATPSSHYVRSESTNLPPVNCVHFFFDLSITLKLWKR
jgi:hypothetical protein